MIHLPDVGILSTRLGVAIVMLYAAWQNSKNAAGRQWTINNTALLFRFVPEDRRRSLAAPAAYVGLVMVWGGGISILLGLEPRLGAAALILFLSLGMLIHRVNRQDAMALGKAISDAAPPVAAKANELAWSAFGAHLAAGLKNVSMIGINVLFLLDGTGRFTLSDCIGRWWSSWMT